MAQLTHIDRYPVIGLLGQGGVGSVYLAEHPELGHKLAVKVLTAGRQASEAQRSRFQREIRALGRVQHPGLVDVIDTGVQEGVPWFAMRYAEGGSLEARLRLGPLRAGEVLDLGLQLCEALGVAHAHGFLHRDLKPDNVLQSGGRYVLVDFGLAKEVFEASGNALSQSGALQGTPGFWAPEQAGGQGNTASVQTDVYGVGATLYAALTGRPPFVGESVFEVAVATREQEPAPPSSLASVPPPLEQIVLRCLAKDPSNRYASTEALAKELAQLARGASASSQGPLSRGTLALGVLVAASLGVLLSATLFVVSKKDFATKGEATSASADPVELARADPEGSSPEAPLPRVGSKSASESRGGSPAELLRLAEEARRRGDHAESVALWRRAAAQGEAAAMFQLGAAFELGRGCPQDWRQAAGWYRRAADLGHGGAMNNLGAFLEQGRGLERDEVEAVKWFRSAIRRGSKPAMKNLAIMLRHGRGIEKSEVEARVWLQRAKFSDAQVTAARLRAWDLCSLGRAEAKVAGAEARYREAIRTDPTCYEAWLELGTLRLSTGRLQAARDPLRRAQQLKPEDPLTTTNLGKLFLREGAPSKALPLFDEVLARTPTNLDVRTCRADCLVRMGRGDEAAGDVSYLLGQLQQIPPGDLLFLGKVCAGSGRLEDAERVFERALQVSPHDPVLVSSFAEVLRRRGKVEAALTHLVELTNSRPDFAPGLVNLGICYTSAKRFKEAVEAHTRAIGIAPSAADAYRGRSHAHYLGGSLGEALEDAAVATRLEPSGRNHNFFGVLLLEGRKDPAAALAHFERAVELAPKELSHRHHRGIARLRLGMAEAAVRDASWVLARARDHPGGLRLLADARRALNDPEAARAALERLLELAPPDQRAGIEEELRRLR